MNIVIATVKSWNIKNAQQLQDRYLDNYNITIIDKKQDLNMDNLKSVNPKYVFFPHWSWNIPEEIYKAFDCIVFHMTDLPFGRGGSPLQNLIVRGIENTKISAIKVEQDIDAGPIYLKRGLNLNGNAEEIFIRASKIIFDDMIIQIIENNIIPHEQKGDITLFKRRTQDQNEINSDLSLEEIYDYIRMLDGEGYPRAFIKLGKYKLNLSRASFKEGKIIADVEIIGGKDE